MTETNEARFTIEGTPSEDPVTGDRGYEATHSQTVDVTLENNPSPVLSVTYSVYDSTDEESPFSSKNAPLLTWVGSGTSKQVMTDPNGTASIVMPATGVHSFVIRCTVSLASGSVSFERMVYIERTDTSPHLRKTVPTESVHCRLRGYSDDLNDIVDAIGGGGGGSNQDLDEAYDAFGSSAATVHVDGVEGQGDLTWDIVGYKSFNIDLANADGTEDGFQVYDGAGEYWRLIRKNNGVIDLEAALQNVGYALSGTYQVSSIGLSLLSTDADMTIGCAGSTGGDLILSNATAAQDIFFSARGSGNIPFNEASPDHVLVGYTATSIIGALNEVKSDCTGFTQGSVIFASATGTLTEDNTNLFWDDSTNRLGIGTNAPAVNLHSYSTTEQLRLGYDGSNYASLTVSSAGLLKVQPTGQLAFADGYLGPSDYDTDFVLSDSSAEWNTFESNFGEVSLLAALNSCATHFDHGALSGLADDDHAQYALLAGRSGGQTLIGGTGTTDDLILRATAGVGASGSDIIFQVGNNGATEAARINYQGNIAIGTTDLDGTPAIGRLVVKGSTADGTTNCFVLRDSSEVNVFWIDTNGGLHTDQWLGQDSNTFIGVGVAGAGTLAHGSGTEGYCNTFVGSDSGFAITTGDNNTGFGYRAGYASTTGRYWTAFGFSAGISNNASYWTAIGGGSSRNVTASSNFVSIGVDAARYINGGSNNTTCASYVCLGYDTRLSADGTTNEIVIGTSAIGYGSNSVVLGNSSITTTILRGNTAIGTTDLDGTPAIGRLVVKGSTADGTTNCFVLRDSSEVNVFWIDTNGGVHTDQWLGQNSNTFIGVGAAGAGTLAHTTGNEGYCNTGFGQNTLYSITLGYRNTAFGYGALYSNTTGYSNNAVGYEALQKNIDGIFNNAMGNWALYSNTSGQFNCAVGPSSGYANTTASYNTSIGEYSLRYNRTGSYNACIGGESGRGVSESSDISNNTCVGFQSGFALLTNGNGNTLLGYAAGDNITTGASNIIIGASCDAPSATASNQLNIGNAIYGLIATPIIGIGTSDLDGTPATGTLTIKGASADGSTNILVGRDSAEVNQFWIDTDGKPTFQGQATLNGGWTDGSATFLTGVLYNSHLTNNTHDLNITPDGAYSVVVDLTQIDVAATDGFFVNLGTDYFRLTRYADNSLLYDTEVNSFEIKAADYGKIDTEGSLSLYSSNLGINTNTYGTSAAGVIALLNGTAPTTSPANTVQLWSADRGATAGKASLHLRTEDGTSHVFGDRVGIGNVAPSCMLDVTGAGAFSSTVTITPSTAVDGLDIVKTNVGNHIHLTGEVNSASNIYGLYIDINNIGAGRAYPIYVDAGTDYLDVSGPQNSLSITGILDDFTITASGDATLESSGFKIEHNATNYSRTVKTGNEVVKHTTGLSMADDAYFDLPASSWGWLMVSVEYDAHAEVKPRFALYTWSISGDVVLVTTNTATYFDDANTDGTFCAYDNGTSVRVQNRLGSTRCVMYSYHYSTAS